MNLSLVKDTLSFLSRWEPPDEYDNYARLVMVDHIQNNNDALQRTSLSAAHVTVSSILIDSEKRTLLTLHRKLGFWMQLGGHIEEEDESVFATALRETREESGISDLTLDLDPLAATLFSGANCPRGSYNTHLDLCFLLRTSSPHLSSRSEESLDLRWWPLDNIPQSCDAGALRLINKARQRIGSTGAAI